MPQFRSMPSFDAFDDDEDERSVTEGLSASFPAISSPATSSITVRATSIKAYAGSTGELFPVTGQYPVLNTEQIAAIAAKTGGLEIEAQEAPSLIAALQATIPSSTTGRLTVIPAEMKRPRPPAKEQQTEKLPVRGPRLSTRLRQGIIITSIFTVLMITLVSLAPLDNGQTPFQVFSGLNNWVRSGQLSWLLTSQHQQVAQKQGSTQQNNAPVPPPMNLPTSQYVAIAQQDATNAGISPVYFVRQINLESGFNPNAVSPAGAVGIAQFLPSTAAGLGINPWDPIQALRGAANLMASYNRKYGGNYAMALAAYNGGSGTVQYAVNNCGNNWMNCLPYETRHYIYVVMGI